MSSSFLHSVLLNKSLGYTGSTDYFRDHTGDEGWQSCINEGMGLNWNCTGGEANVFALKMRGEQMYSCEHRTVYFVHPQNLDMLQRW